MLGPMFSFQPRGFGASGQEPWFRIGTFEVGTTALLTGSIVLSIFVRALEGASAPLTKWLAFDPDAIARGEVWRLFTWWFPNEPSLWVIIGAAFAFYLGSQLEGALGKVRALWFYGYCLVGMALLAVLLDVVWQPTGQYLIGAPYRGLTSIVLLAFVCYLPGVRFLFGIPGWVLAAVIIGIELLQLTQYRQASELVWYLLSVWLILLVTKAMGLAEAVEWIPKVPLPAAIGGDPATSARKRRKPSGPTLDDPLEEMEINAILDQVSEKGIHSLSRAQKRKLKAHSAKRKRK